MLRRQFNKIALISLAAALAPFPAAAEPALDQPAPAFSGLGADGKTLDLKDFHGKTVVLEWTNHDCPFVKKHYDSGNIPLLQKEASAKGFVWLQVISSAPGKQGHVDGATAIKLNAARGATPTGTLLDPEGKIGKLYGAQTSPHFFIINPQGVLVYKGGIDSIASAQQEDIAKAENYVRAAFTSLSAGTRIANPSTKPYGCSIKYAT
jgi:hypothetical protein